MRRLDVTLLRDGVPFLEGCFEVSWEEYGTVKPMLDEVEMSHEQAASLLSGYMHAGDVGTLTEDMGKIAMVAAVYMIEAGETAIEIPFETSGEIKQ